MTDPDSWWLDELAYAGREHFDEQHARRYDAKMDAQADEEIRLLQDTGALGPGASVIDLGAGSGQFALAVAGVCDKVVAVDVSPVMLARLEDKLARAGAGNVEVVQSGFLTYEHAGEPADVVYSFDAADAERCIEDWIRETVGADVERGWTRAELAEHVRDEHSTFTWLLEPMIERAGFEITRADYDTAGMLARYTCARR